MQSYKDLIVWQRSFQLCTSVYGLTRKFPQEERFGLVNQLRRASVSIMSNIAEGYSRKTRKETRQFFSIAFGSTSEVEAQLLLAQEVGMSPPDTFATSMSLLSEVRKMLSRLLSKF